MYLGDELTEVLESFEKGGTYEGHGRVDMETGVKVLPHFQKDTTDRNRTSPFAFTGNKFEFRMLGSSLSIACPNIMLNTIVAEELSQFADILEKSEDFSAAVTAIIQDTMKNHKRIIFNGNNYSDEWVKEAERRGLYNLKSTAEALPYYIADRNIQLFTKHNIFTPEEMHSRFEIQLDNYCKVLHIEALTMLEMARRDILPAVGSYIKELSETAKDKKAFSAQLSCQVEEALLEKLSNLSYCLYKKTEKLDEAILGAKNHTELTDSANYYYESVFGAMRELRAVADELETITAEKHWPFPTYGDLLFRV